MPLPAFRLFPSLLAGLLVSTPALADPVITLDVLHEATSAAGDAVLLPVETALPGEMLHYRITVTNPDPDPAKNISMVMAIDPHLQIDPDSFSGLSQALFSVDDGAAYAPFANLVVETETGTRPATPDDLTHMKLTLPKVPAESGTTINYLAKVE